MFSWSEEAREARDLLDALICVEAVSAQSPTSFLDGVREDARHTCLPEVRNKEAVAEGWTYQRNVRALKLQDCPGGSRWLCSTVEHATVPPPEDAEAKRLSEKVFVFSMAAPAELIEDALNAVPLQQRSSLISSGLQRLGFSSSQAAAETPSPQATFLANPAGSGRQAHVARIVADLAEQLIHVEGLGRRRTPRLHAPYAEAAAVLVSGHGPGALLAYAVVRQLLHLYPDALRGRVRCITFGMPLMGCGTPDEREAALRASSPHSETLPVPMYTRNAANARRPAFLPLPTYQHVLRSRDLLARCTLCSSALRQRVREVLRAARIATRDSLRLAAPVSPYANAVASAPAAPAAGVPGEPEVRSGVQPGELEKVLQRVEAELEKLKKVGVVEHWPLGSYWFVNDDEEEEGGRGAGVSVVHFGSLLVPPLDRRAREQGTEWNLKHLELEAQGATAAALLVAQLRRSTLQSEGARGGGRRGARGQRSRREEWAGGLEVGGEGRVWGGWLEEHHLGMYVRAVHSVVAAEESQRERLQEMAGLLQRRGRRLKLDGRDAEEAQLLQEAFTLADKALLIGAACQPRAEAASAVALHAEGTKAFLQLTIRGSNLSYVEQVLLRFPRDDDDDGEEEVARDAESESGEFVEWVTPCALANKQLVVRSEGPFGRVHRRVQAVLCGSSFQAVQVQCDLASTPFEALRGPKRRFAAMPLAALFEHAFTYAALLGDSVEVVRERGGLQTERATSRRLGMIKKGLFQSKEKAKHTDRTAGMCRGQAEYGVAWRVHGCLKEFMGRLHQRVSEVDREQQRFSALRAALGREQDESALEERLSALVHGDEAPGAGEPDGAGGGVGRILGEDQVEGRFRAQDDVEGERAQLMGDLEACVAALRESYAQLAAARLQPMYVESDPGYGAGGGSLFAALCCREPAEEQRASSPSAGSTLPAITEGGGEGAGAGEAAGDGKQGTGVARGMSEAELRGKVAEELSVHWAAHGFEEREEERAAAVETVAGGAWGEEALGKLVARWSPAVLSAAAQVLKERVTVVECVALSTKSVLSPTARARRARGWEGEAEERQETAPREVPARGGEFGTLRAVTYCPGRSDGEAGEEGGNGEGKEGGEEGEGARGVLLLHLAGWHWDRLVRRAERPESTSAMLRRAAGAWGEEADLLDRLIADLDNLESQTRSSWNEFKRLMSLGGSEPAPEADDVAMLQELRQRFHGVGTVEGRDLAELLLLEVKPRLEAVQAFVDRPLSLSMDRSDKSRTVMGLLKAMVFGGTVMAGACLLAPASAAALVPAALAGAVASPPAAVAATASGVFVTSMLQSHSQARCTCTGDYTEKLQQFAQAALVRVLARWCVRGADGARGGQALGIDVGKVEPDAFYLEAAISARVLDHLRCDTRILPSELPAVLSQPERFVAELAGLDVWSRLFDPAHFFEFLDTGDKRIVVNFLWAFIAIHNLRVQMKRDVAVMVRGAGEAERLALVSRIFRVSTHVLAAADDAEAPRKPPQRPVLTLRLHEVAKHFRVDVATEAGEPDPRVADSGDEGEREARMLGTSFVDLAMQLSSVQLLVIPWEDVESDENVLLVAKALAMQGTLFKVLFNRSPTPAAGEDEALAAAERMPGLEEVPVGRVKNLILQYEAGKELEEAVARVNARLDVGHFLLFVEQAQRELKAAPHLVHSAELGRRAAESMRSRGLEAHLPSPLQVQLLALAGFLGPDHAHGQEVAKLSPRCCAFTSVAPAGAARGGAGDAGVADGVEEVRQWVRDAVCEAVFGLPQERLAGKERRTVERFFEARRAEDEVEVLQAAVRRRIQRHVLPVLERYDPGARGWEYRRHGTRYRGLFPRDRYWPRVGPDDTMVPERQREEGGAEAAERVATVAELVWGRAQFRQKFQNMLSLYRAHALRIGQLQRFQLELSAAIEAGDRRGDRSHRLSDTLRSRIFAGMPSKEVLEEDQGRQEGDEQEPVGAGALLSAALGGLPLPGEAVGECFEVAVQPAYMSMVQLFSCTPLISSAARARQVVELLREAGSVCSPPLGSVLLDVGFRGPLENVLYSPFPPPLYLRVVLKLLLNCCPEAHPDRTNLEVAVAQIDKEAFALGKTDAEGGWCSLLGTFGEFFNEFEEKCAHSPPSPSPSAAGELQGSTSFQLSMAWIPGVGPAELLSGAQPLDAGRPQRLTKAISMIKEFREQVLSKGEACFVEAQEFDVVKESVNAVILTQLWPTVLREMYQSEQQARDAELAKGLPAFSWQSDQKELCAFLNLPKAVLGEDGAVKDAAMPGIDSAAHELHKVSRECTPEGKAGAIVSARRAVVRMLAALYAEEGRAGGERRRGGAVLSVGEDEVAPCLTYVILLALHRARTQGLQCSFHADLQYIRDLRVPLDADSGETAAYVDMFYAMLCFVDECRMEMASPGKQRNAADQEAYQAIYEKLVAAAEGGQWEDTVRMVEENQLRPLYATGSGSALEAACRAGRQELALYLMYSAALDTSVYPLGSTGNVDLFGDCGCNKQLKQLTTRASLEQGLYSMRALEMLRSHAFYTERLRALKAAVGPRQPWMEEDDTFKKLFGNVDVNLQVAEMVAEEMRGAFERCIRERSVLKGFAKVLGGNTLQVAIRAVGLQFDEVKEATELLGKMFSADSALWGQWKAYLQAVEQRLGVHIYAALSEPLQRAMRYKEEARALLHAAAGASGATRDRRIAASDITPGSIMERPSLEVAERLEALRARPGGEEVCVADLPDVVRAHLKLEAETMRLNERRREYQERQKAAERAHKLLVGVQGAEDVLERPVWLVAEATALCSLRGEAERPVEVLLLCGTQPEILINSTVGVQGRKACDRRVELACVAGIDAQTEDRPGAAEAGQELHYLTISIRLRVAAKEDAPAAERDKDGDAEPAAEVLLLRAPLGARRAAIGIESLLQPILGGPPPDANALQKLVVEAKMLLRDVMKRGSGAATGRDSAGGGAEAAGEDKRTSLTAVRRRELLSPAED